MACSSGDCCSVMLVRGGEKHALSKQWRPSRWWKGASAPAACFVRLVSLYVDRMSNDPAEDAARRRADDAALHAITARRRTDHRTGRGTDHGVTLRIPLRLGWLTRHARIA